MDSIEDREALLLNLNEKNYNPLNDVLFKFIFGKEERKQITIDFLNSVLLDYLHHEIKDLAFAPTEMSPEHEYDKLTRLDVACVLDSGEQVGTSNKSEEYAEQVTLLLGTDVCDVTTQW